MEDWLRLIDHHLRLRHHMDAQDIYKLLYQGLLGSEHLISSPDDFKAYLQVEFNSLEAVLDEALWEPIRPDGRLLRLNLRPFKARGHNLDGLVDACLQTARSTWNTPAELRAVWTAAEESCAAQRWPQQALADFHTLIALLEPQGYPPVHHSRHYTEVYQPAYRLVAADLLTESAALA